MVERNVISETVPGGNNVHQKVGAVPSGDLSVDLTTDVTGILPFANGGTGASAFPSGRIPFSNGSEFISEAELNYDTASNLLGVGIPTPLESGDFAGAIRVGPALGTINGTMRFFGGDLEGRVGGAWKSLTGLGFIDGSGTANFLPKFTDSDTLADSIIEEVSSKIGIGTSGTVDRLLHLFGGANDVFLKVETTKAGGEALVEFVNDADSWFTGINANDDIVFRNGGEDIVRYADGAFGGSLIISATTFIFNQDGDNIDFRLEGVGNANLIRTDASNLRVGILDGSPSHVFDCNGDGRFTGDLRVDGENINSRVTFPGGLASSPGGGGVGIGLNGVQPIANSIGMVMPRAGSIVSVSCYATLITKGGANETVDVQVFVDAALVFSATSATFTAAAQKERWSATQAEGTDTFAADDLVVLIFGSHDGSNAYGEIIAQFEVQWS